MEQNEKKQNLNEDSDAMRKEHEKMLEDDTGTSIRYMVEAAQF